MEETTLALSPVGLIPAVTPCWGEVVAAEAGRARSVAVDTEAGPTEWAVAGHARELAPVAPGDRVVVLLDAAERAAYLVHVLAAVDEPPRCGLELRPDGAYVFRADGRAVRLEVAGADLELGRDGVVRIAGEAIDTRARGVHRIRGARVAIN